MDNLSSLINSRNQLKSQEHLLPFLKLLASSTSTSDRSHLLSILLTTPPALLSPQTRKLLKILQTYLADSIKSRHFNTSSSICAILNRIPLVVDDLKETKIGVLLRKVVAKGDVVDDKLGKEMQSVIDRFMRISQLEKTQAAVAPPPKEEVKKRKLETEKESKVTAVAFNIFDTIAAAKKEPKPITKSPTVLQPKTPTLAKSPAPLIPGSANSSRTPSITESPPLSPTFDLTTTDSIPLKSYRRSNSPSPPLDLDGQPNKKKRVSFATGDSLTSIRYFQNTPEEVFYRKGSTKGEMKEIIKSEWKPPMPLHLGYTFGQESVEKHTQERRESTVQRAGDGEAIELEDWYRPVTSKNPVDIPLYDTSLLQQPQSTQQSSNVNALLALLQQPPPQPVQPQVDISSILSALQNIQR